MCIRNLRTGADEPEQNFDLDGVLCSVEFRLPLPPPTVSKKALKLKAQARSFTRKVKNSQLSFLLSFLRKARSQLILATEPTVPLAVPLRPQASTVKSLRHQSNLGTRT